MSNKSTSTELNDLTTHMVELEHKLTFQQQAFDQLNGVVLEQHAEIERLRHEIESLRRLLHGLAESGVSEDLPHEKPPHY